MVEQGVTRAVATAEYQSRVKNLKLDTPMIPASRVGGLRCSLLSDTDVLLVGS